MSPAFAPWARDTHPFGDGQDDFALLIRPQDFLLDTRQQRVLPSILLMPGGELRVKNDGWFGAELERVERSPTMSPYRNVGISVDRRATIGDLRYAARHLRGFTGLTLSWKNSDANLAHAAQERWGFLAPIATRRAELEVLFDRGACQRPEDTHQDCTNRQMIPEQDDMRIATWLETIDFADSEDEPVHYVLPAPTETLEGVMTWVDEPRQRYSRSWIDLEYLVGIPLGVLFSLLWLGALFRRELRIVHTVWAETTAIQGPAAERKIPWWTPQNQLTRRVSRCDGPYRQGGQAVMVASPELARRSWRLQLQHLLRAQLTSGVRWLLVVFIAVLLMSLMMSFDKWGAF